MISTFHIQPMIINSTKFLTFILYVCCVVVPPAPAQQPANIQSRVAYNLRESQTHRKYSFETTFEVRIHEASPINESLKRPDAWVQHDEIDYFVCHDTFIMNRRMFEPSSAKTPLHMTYRQTVAWFDGASRTNTDDDNSVTIGTATVPGDLASMGYLFNHMDGRFPAHRPLDDVVEKSHPISFVEDDATMTYRFALEPATANSIQMSVTLRKTGAHWQLIEYRTELSDAPTAESFDDDVYYRSSFRILSWQDDGRGTMIPEAAELAITGPTYMPDHSSPQVMAMTTYTRKTFALIDDNCDQSVRNPIELAAGTKVYDDRLKLSYEIGKDYLYWDGTMYRLNEPLLEPPNNRLEELLASAQALPTIAAPNQETIPVGVADLEPSDNDPLKKNVIVILVLATSAGTLFMFGLMFMRRHRKSSPQ